MRSWVKLFGSSRACGRLAISAFERKNKSFASSRALASSRTASHTRSWVKPFGSSRALYVVWIASLNIVCPIFPYAHLSKVVRELASSPSAFLKDWTRSIFFNAFGRFSFTFRWNRCVAIVIITVAVLLILYLAYYKKLTFCCN